MTLGEAEQVLRRNVADNGGFEAWAAREEWSSPTPLQRRPDCAIALECARDDEGEPVYSCVWLVGALTVGHVQGSSLLECAQALAQMLSSYGF